MAVNYIKVSTNRLNVDAQQIESLIGSMKKEMGNMKNSVKQLNSMWEGVSKKAFVQAFNDDMTALASVIDSLSAIRNFETETKNKYENCEKQVAQLVDSIRV